MNEDYKLAVRLTVMTVIVFSASAAAMAKSSSVTVDVWMGGGIGAIVGLFFGVFFVVPETFKAINPEIRRVAYELRHPAIAEKKTFAPDVPIPIEAVTEGGNQVDYFYGLTPDQWHKCALRIAAHIRAGNRSFTFSVVGQTERKLLVPMMQAAEYIESVGEGEYRITDKGANWWMGLAATPYPWDHAPQKLRFFSENGIYT